MANLQNQSWVVSEAPNHRLKSFGVSGKAPGSLLVGRKKFEKIMNNRPNDDFGHFFGNLQNPSWMVPALPNHRFRSFRGSGKASGSILVATETWRTRLLLRLPPWAVVGQSVAVLAQAFLGSSRSAFLGSLR